MCSDQTMGVRKIAHLYNMLVGTSLKCLVRPHGHSRRWWLGQKGKKTFLAHNIVSQQRDIASCSAVPWRGLSFLSSLVCSLSLAPIWAPCFSLRLSPAWAGTSLFLSHLIPTSIWGICPGTLAKTRKFITLVMTACLMLSEFCNLPQLLLCQNPWSCKILPIRATVIFAWRMSLLASVIRYQP